MAYNIKSIKKEFAEKGIFYTQPELANYLKTFLPADVKEVYDPTCGNGGLLSVFDDDVEKYGQEINAEQLADAEKHLSNFHGACGDTLKLPAWIDRKFDYIVANPPFSIKWEPPKIDMFDTDPRFEMSPVLPPKSMADYAFLLHILYMLSDKGLAVVLNSSGVTFRGNAEGNIRKWLCEYNFIEKVVAVPSGQFVDTNIATYIFVLSKHKENTDITFINKEDGKVATISFDEIARNNFNLSVNLYIQHEYQKIDYEPTHVILNDIQEKMLEEMENMHNLCNLLSADDNSITLNNFVDKAQSIISKMKQSEFYKTEKQK